MHKNKIPIVNDRDEIIGYKDRAGLDYENNIYRVSALWLTNSKKEILIAQRAMTKERNPGKWGPAVAGTVEEGETYESNIEKEIKEEIGLTDIKLKRGPKRSPVLKRSYFVQWFIATIDKEISEFRIQEDEVEKVAWIPLEELTKDVAVNPSKYLGSMPEILKLFTKTPSGFVQ